MDIRFVRCLFVPPGSASADKKDIKLQKGGGEAVDDGVSKRENVKNIIIVQR